VLIHKHLSLLTSHGSQDPAVAAKRWQVGYDLGYGMVSCPEQAEQLAEARL
jgi:hypothetical protein